jgi:hypothetical protein
MWDPVWPTLIAIGLGVFVWGFVQSLRLFRQLIESGPACRRMVEWLRGSVCFWCGALVFFALIGIWADSYRMMSQVRSSQAGTDRYWSVALNRGWVIAYSIEEEIESIPVGPREISFHREPGSGAELDREFAWGQVWNLEKALAADGSWRVTLRQYSSRMPLAPVGIVFVLIWGLCLVVAAKLGKKEEGRGGDSPAATMDGVDGER